MEINIRLEEERDYRIVEALTREAFWNVYVPGCNEHLLIHTIRKAEEFVKELDYVALYNNEIVGNIVYVKTKIISIAAKEEPVLTFGPISVLPKYQHKGIGTRLIEHTKNAATKMGYTAILLYGDPEYYKRFGFKVSMEYNITNKDGKYPAALLALELYPRALDSIQGTFDAGSVYAINEDELETFEKNFIQKEKRITKTQERFKELSGTYLYGGNP